MTDKNETKKRLQDDSATPRCLGGACLASAGWMAACRRNPASVSLPMGPLGPIPGFIQPPSPQSAPALCHQFFTGAAL